MRCWNAVLMAEKKQNVNHYFFQWLRSSTPEEEIYQNLIDLQTGRQKLTELDSRPTVSRINTFFPFFDSGGRTRVGTRKAQAPTLILG